MIETDSAKSAVPLEDIWVLIIETRHALITTALLSDLAAAGIGVMTCGENHMPNGLHLPLAAHSRHAAIVEDQLSITKPMKKRIWQRLVQAKIRNQASVLDILGLPGGDVLRENAKQVLSGDSTEREAVAAGLYFKKILPDGTRRNSSFTAALDYGYAVLRAGVARTAVSGGWLVSRGVHHCNNMNPFNLVDDLIEPYRPIADLLVTSLSDGAALNPENKVRLASVFENKVMMGQEKVSVQTSIEMQLDSLRKAVLGKDASLLCLPRILPFAEQHPEL